MYGRVVNLSKMASKKFSSFRAILTSIKVIIWINDNDNVDKMIFKSFFADGRSKFQRHVQNLIWKSYLQRQRRWRLLVCETGFAGILFLMTIFIAKPVFLTPLQAVPEAPLASADIIASLNTKNIIGYTPNTSPYVSIMAEVSQRLHVEMMSAPTEDDLNVQLYNRSRSSPFKNSVIWVVWKPNEGNIWKYNIRSTERARSVTKPDAVSCNPHLRSGFLAVQLAVSEAILSFVSEKPLRYELSLVAMPVSPLMQQEKVQRAISGILLCFIIALLPPVLETEALVVTETNNQFKRSLRIRNVEYAPIYLGWLTYAYMTVIPVCALAAITLILIFRWVHLFLTFIVVFMYVSVMIMFAFIMAMFQKKAWMACVWTTLLTLMHSFLAELIIHHQLDLKHGALTFFLQLLIPPLGLAHGFNDFALLQTGQSRWEGQSLVFTLLSWLVMIILYFGLLMVLQRTLKNIAIGGPVSWKTAIFKKVEDVNKLHQIESPSVLDREKLQEVDELVAKAISLRNVSKSIMDGPTVLSNVTMDIYRGEYTVLFSERIQSRMLDTIEDLLAGVCFPDKGTINVLGEDLVPGKNFMSVPYMMGYCHRSSFLIDDLTVEEHLTLFCFLCLWNESSADVSEYNLIRLKYLLVECDLECVRHSYVRNVDIYYKAQLCWAIAMLLEPRVIMIPSFSGNPMVSYVIQDKIMKYRSYITIIKASHTSFSLEYADRVFIFDTKQLIFGGTPAYMFFRYGRDYRVRVTFRCDSEKADRNINELLSETSAMGARIRAHLGCLLILIMPVTPTENVYKLVKYFTKNTSRYGIISMNVSIPDSEEVCSRAIGESRSSIHGSDIDHEISRNAIKHISENRCRPWKRMGRTWGNPTDVQYIAWKFYTFYNNYKSYFVITVVAALVAGVFIGIRLAYLLVDMEIDRWAKKIIFGEVLTVETLEQKTNFILRLDDSAEAKSIANAYVLSETNSTGKQIENVCYTALSHHESLTEYLVTKAIDSPQRYVFLYAYGLDVHTATNVEDNSTYINVKVLYSPLHHDQAAAARSLARAYMALIRYVTSRLDATIQVTDDPLTLDLSVWSKIVSSPPFVIQFMLVLTILHIPLLPSKESGFIRHTQCRAMVSSPARYWLTLYFCDLMFFLLLVGLITATFILMMILIPPQTFRYSDLVIVPIILGAYGFSCIPQAYLFSLGPRVALNTVTYFISALVLGETTMVAKIVHGDIFNYAINFMVLSPQFNMAYAFIKFRTIFLYNNECVIFKRQNFCSSTTLHKCCQSCGVLQDCFSRKFYILGPDGVLMQILAMVSTAVLFWTILLLWEYEFVQRLWVYLIVKWIRPNMREREPNKLGVIQEKADVLNKMKELESKKKGKVDTFGEYLLVSNVSKRRARSFNIKNIYFGVGKGEVFALSGLRDHGRTRLCHILAGYHLPNDGQLWCMSKWRLIRDPIMYARHVSLSCEKDPLPPWMTVYNGLELISVLRGVPQSHVKAEIMNYIDAIELSFHVNTPIQLLPLDYQKRLHFAAAVVGAPPVIVLDECTAYQKYSVRRAMYYILSMLRSRGHAIIVCSSNVETHLPLTNRLAILLQGRIYDIDQLDNLVERFGNKGYTAVLHLKDEIDVVKLFSKYFKNFIINDLSEVLVNVQICDTDLNTK